jgi:cytochrome c oxidase assembly protein subunit 15
MDDLTARATRARRRVAVCCAVLMGAVVVASAFLRHHDAGAAMQAASAAPLAAAARLLHRVAATAVLLGAVALVLLARAGPARDVKAQRLAWALLGVALLLSALGIAAGASRSAPVVLANLLGGFAMLALCVRLTMDPARRDGSRGAWAMLGLASLQAAAGAVPECIGLTGCPTFSLAHRIAGVLLALALLMLGLWASSQRRRRSGAMLAVASVALLLTGAVAAASGPLAMPALVVVHNALAATALACLVRLA